MFRGNLLWVKSALTAPPALLTQIFHGCHADDTLVRQHRVMGYLHQLPGRLRLRSGVLKQNPKLASDLLTAIGMMPGVRSVDVSIVTGSVLVHHDPLRVSSDQLIAALRSHGVVHEATAAATSSSKGPSLPRTVGNAVLAAVLQQALERAVLGLVSILL